MPNWKTWLGQWLIVCIATQLLQIWGDGVASWFISATGVSSTGEPSILLGIIVLRLFSASLGGILQWQVLRPWFPTVRGWALATSLGSTISFGLVNGLYSATLLLPAGNSLDRMMPPISVLPQFVFAGLSGLVLGIAQWLVLRGKVSQAGLWVVLSCAGLVFTDLCTRGLQRFLSLTGIDVTQGAWNPVYWMMSSLGILLYGAITGRFWVSRIHQQFGNRLK